MPFLCGLLFKESLHDLGSQCSALSSHLHHLSLDVVSMLLPSQIRISLLSHTFTLSRLDLLKSTHCDIHLALFPIQLDVLTCRHIISLCGPLCLLFSQVKQLTF